MQNKIFQQEFELEKYINDRLLERKDDTEHKQLREIMDSLFTPFYQYMEKRYEMLEERMAEELNQNENAYDVVTTICPREKIIAYENTMFPILKEDEERQYLKVEDLINCLEENREFYCCTVYGKMEFALLQNLWQQPQKFRGKIKTSDGEFEAYFIVKKSKKYEAEIGKLYRIFQQNQVPWHTLQFPYMNKMLDVYLVDASYPEGEVIESVDIDFQEYSGQILFEMVPMWNIGKRTIRSSAYPSFEVDQINFIHCIYSSQLQEDCKYLVANQQVEYWNVRREAGDLCIECKKADPISWELLELHSEVKCYHKDGYPLMSNAREDSTDNGIISTLSGVVKYVGELKVGDYLKLREIQQIGFDYPEEHTTYSMDEAIQEELQVQGKRSGLLLVFEAVDRENYLTGDVLSYVVSSVQWQLREYQCFGKLM